MSRTFNLSRFQGHYLRTLYLKYSLNLKDSLSQKLTCFSKTVLLKKTNLTQPQGPLYVNLDFNVDGHGHATWASSMGMQLRMQHGHVAWACKVHAHP